MAGGRPDSFRDLILERLEGLEGLTCRSMFGGCGLYAGGVFFGILHRGRLYFKTSAATRRRYIEAGMGPFRPTARQTLSSYYEVPAAAIDGPRALVAWARESVAAAASH